MRKNHQRQGRTELPNSVRYLLHLKIKAEDSLQLLSHALPRRSLCLLE